MAAVGVRELGAEEVNGQTDTTKIVVLFSVATCFDRFGFSFVY